MRINDKMLVIPPFLSTSWGQVRFLYMKGTDLIVALSNGDNVALPGLAPELLAKIFASHAAYLENRAAEESTLKQAVAQPLVNTGFSVELPFKMPGGLENLGSALHHNPAQSHLPDLPSEILKKISSIAKIVSPEERATMPKPEPHCNCVHCQIVRTIGQSLDHELEPQAEEQPPEEIIPDDELQFQQWDIVQTGDQLFSVTNRLDTLEHYSVYLGDPVGCTCGKQGCEHILAVLKS